MRSLILTLALTFAAGTAQAATLTTLKYGVYGPQNDALTLGQDGQLYGTASGGTYDNGIVYKISTAGAFTTLANLKTSVSGQGSPGGLVFDSGGNIFGVGNDAAGASARETIFKLTPSGTLSRFATLGIATYPNDGLTIDASNNIYGVTPYGGANGYGTVFKVSSTGVSSTLATFNQANGAFPANQLTLDAAGNIYGTTENGGLGVSQYNNGYGTLFKLSNTGVLTTLIEFSGLNGAYPRGKLAIDGNGNLFGTTTANTIFEYSQAGVFTTLAKFTGINGLGTNPTGGLLLDAAGNLFGTTVNGGDTVFGLGKGYGTVFELTKSGVLKTLSTFDNANGANPYAGLTADAFGNLYGTTQNGPNNIGTIFRLGDTGFVPFTASVPEPATWALMLLGFGGIGAAMRRGNRRAAAKTAAEAHYLR
jgi:uncharacterized repeat protein (TIGR03803 family)